MINEALTSQDSQIEGRGVLKVKEALQGGGWVFFDIDGTLQDESGIPHNLPTEIARLTSLGIEVGVCTS
ncbi:MAG: hypothetical protein ACMG6E_00690, partial [Candidatus Roizmanbacteria bacterium]